VSEKWLVIVESDEREEELEQTGSMEGNFVIMRVMRTRTRTRGT
jgi:hypothetical protein